MSLEYRARSHPNKNAMAVDRAVVFSCISVSCASVMSLRSTLPSAMIMSSTPACPATDPPLSVTTANTFWKCSR